MTTISNSTLDADSGGENEPLIRGEFPRTSVTELIQARGNNTQAQAAMGRLCQRYWHPLYGFLRRRGYSVDDSQDLTQGFFAGFLKGKNFGGFDKRRGKLRSYLLGALKHHVANWHRDKRSIKSGGEIQFISFEWLQAESQYEAESREIDSPDLLYDRRWVLNLLRDVHEELRSEHVKNGKKEFFDVLHAFMDDRSPGGAAQADAAAQLGMTPNAVKTAVSRMRQDRERIVRSQIAATVASPDLIDEEIAYFISLFAPSSGGSAGLQVNL